MNSTPQIIAVSNRKGGTGKTTASVNFAAELAALGRRVLLVDLDSQGHCAIGLGIKAVTDIQQTVHNLFVAPDAEIHQAILKSSFTNLSLLPADQLFEHGSGLRDVQLLSQALKAKEIADQFDVVILDTPPSLDVLLLNALHAANWVLVPYVPHQLSYEGMRQLVRVLFKVMSGANTDLKILGFLPMMVTQHICQHRIITGEVSRQFGANRVLPGIRSDIRLAEAFAVGKPVRHYAPRCRGAFDFAALAVSLNSALQ
ncbi:ParA family protein [Methylicorpusculum sp.]|uniref:ParA family protein n=1 Tax=Methylicorpusculum sp. TaxID=2713644 RepID=UPI002717BB95|nr:ParA family protein [Methylicorpusculum sp.]MDO8844836.1 ParA family protein [Methylicorpusculum sp.]